MKKKTAIMRVIDRVKDNVTRKIRRSGWGWPETIIIVFVTVIIGISLTELLRRVGA